ncbi:hypothetical protein TIFTF001_035618 [Ficus carica]|uniref:Uncharacterized protein n=1 Tax=Ficus carica TaxID=3494 RepID=A0AA88E2K3_FICCA|nr:hypothetical protein TIFTF001_035618 [Ficus carica]
MKQGKNKIKHHYDKQDAYVVSTRVRSGLVHGLSWTRLAAPTTPWLRATVSDLPAILDAILWRVGAADCEKWNGHHHGFWKIEKFQVCMASKLPLVVPIRARSGLVHDLGTQVSTYEYV